MSPDQFVGKLKQNGAAPACLFLGPEVFNRDRCRRALIDAVLSPEEREEGISRFDLQEVPLRDVVDDARAMSLFASRRLLIVSNAEAILPRGKAAASEEEEGEGGAGSADALVEYLRDPTPGVFILVEAVRFDFEGDDKKKLERVQKFFSAIHEVVELRRLSLDDARRRAQTLASEAKLNIPGPTLEMLVESMGGDVARIAVELEKLQLLTGGRRSVTDDDILTMVPDARASTIFALVNAMGRRDRRRSLEILDTLTRDGEYLPLALSFLSGQMRMALAAQEAGLRSAGQIQGYFSRAGVQVWGSRAEQIQQTVSRFSPDQLRRSLTLIFEADRGLRDTRPDDRVILERLILQLTA